MNGLPDRITQFLDENAASTDNFNRPIREANAAFAEIDQQITSHTADLSNLQANLDAAEADIAALDAGKAETATYTITLTAAGWQGAAAPYTQTVAVAGILVTDTPHYTAVYSGTNDQKIAQQEAWSMVSEDSTANGSITFVCFEDKPEVDLALQLEVIR